MNAFKTFLVNYKWQLLGPYLLTLILMFFLFFWNRSAAFNLNQVGWILKSSIVSSIFGPFLLAYIQGSFLESIYFGAGILVIVSAICSQLFFARYRTKTRMFISIFIWNLLGAISILGASV